MEKHEYTELLGGNAKKELEAVITAVEGLVEQRKDINEEIRNTLEIAQINGFDKKTIKEIIKLRKLEKEELQAQENMRDAYLIALGLL